MSRKPKTPNRKKIPAGVYPRKNADGTISYQVKFRSNKNGTVVNDIETKATLEEAAAWIAERKAKFKLDGGKSLSKLEKSKANTPFRDVIDRYVKEVVMLKEEPDKDRNLYNKLKKEAWTAWPIGAITNVEVQAYINRRLADHKKSSTINNAINKISIVYKQCMGPEPEWRIPGLINPTIGVKRPKANDGRFATMTNEQLGRLLAECEKGPSYLIWFVKLAILTGMRAGEIRKFNWRDYHQVETEHTSGAYWHLPKTKNGKPREVPLLPEAEGICIAMKEALPKRLDGFVFGDPKKKAKDGGITEDMVTNAYRDAAMRAGFVDQAAMEEKRARGKNPIFISSLTFHDLRHVSISQLAQFYSNEMKLADTTGHRDARILSRYYNNSGAKKVELLHFGASKHDADMEAWKQREAAKREKLEAELTAKIEAEQRRVREMQMAVDSAEEMNRYYRLRDLRGQPPSPARDAEIARLEAETAAFHEKYPEAKTSSELAWEERLQDIADDQAASEALDRSIENDDDSDERERRHDY